MRFESASSIIHSNGTKNQCNHCNSTALAVGRFPVGRFPVGRFPVGRFSKTVELAVFPKRHAARTRIYSHSFNRVPIGPRYATKRPAVSTRLNDCRLALRFRRLCKILLQKQKRLLRRVRIDKRHQMRFVLHDDILARNLMLLKRFQHPLR
jgi:hypothetical protein